MSINCPTGIVCVSKVKLKEEINIIARANSEAYDTNKMAEEFTHQFLDQAFSVGQQVNLAFAFSASYTLMGHIYRIQGTPSIRMNNLSLSQ